MGGAAAILYGGSNPTAYGGAAHWAGLEAIFLYPDPDTGPGPGSDVAVYRGATHWAGLEASSLTDPGPGPGPNELTPYTDLSLTLGTLTSSP